MVNNKYLRLRKVLGSIFSVEIGLSTEARDSFFTAHVLENSILLEDLKKELLDLFNDKDVDWVELGINQELIKNMK